MHIISHVRTGYSWMKPQHTHCYALHSVSMCLAQPRDHQERSHCYRMPLFRAVSIPLFSLYTYYTDYFSYYTHYIKTRNCDSGQYSLRKSASLGGSSSRTHALSNRCSRRFGVLLKRFDALHKINSV